MKENQGLCKLMHTESERKQGRSDHTKLVNKELKEITVCYFEKVHVIARQSLT
jgi:hypothetical protein